MKGVKNTLSKRIGEKKYMEGQKKGGMVWFGCKESNRKNKTNIHNRVKQKGSPLEGKMS